MTHAIQTLIPTELDQICGGVAVPDAPTFQDYIDIAQAAHEITLWRLGQYGPVPVIP